MIAGGRRLGETGMATCQESGKKHARLHLSTCDQAFVIHTVKLTAANCEGRELSVCCLNLRAHRAERLDYALHRPSTKAYVAVNRRDESLPGEESAKHSNCRARIAGIKLSRDV